MNTASLETQAPVVVAMHVAPATRLEMKSVHRVEVETGKGIVGDRYHGTRHRHVTVQSLEALGAASEIHGSEIDPSLTRRNITVSTGEIPASPGDLISIGPVQLEVVRIAAPCKLLDDLLGPGAKTALRRRAGSVCRVLAGGPVSLGDPVSFPVGRFGA